MKTVQLFLLVLLYSRCESASRHKSGRKRTNSREHDIDKDSSNKRSQALTGSDSVPVECSPLPYLTTVRLGTCRRQVVTKVSQAWDLVLLRQWRTCCVSNRCAMDVVKASQLTQTLEGQKKHLVESASHLIVAQPLKRDTFHTGWNAESKVLVGS
jgi:hypothetical protein